MAKSDLPELAPIQRTSEQMPISKVISLCSSWLFATRALNLDNDKFGSLDLGFGSKQVLSDFCSYLSMHAMARL